MLNNTYVSIYVSEMLLNNKFGELIYAWKKVRLKSRLGSILTFFPGSVNLDFFPQVQTWKSPTKHSKISRLQPGI